MRKIPPWTFYSPYPFHFGDILLITIVWAITVIWDTKVNTLNAALFSFCKVIPTVLKITPSDHENKWETVPGNKAVHLYEETILLATDFTLRERLYNKVLGVSSTVILLFSSRRPLTSSQCISSCFLAHEIQFTHSPPCICLLFFPSVSAALYALYHLIHCHINIKGSMLLNRDPSVWQMQQVSSIHSDAEWGHYLCDCSLCGWERSPHPYSINTQDL